MSNVSELLKDPTIRTVGCSFTPGGRIYTYCTRQTNLKVGDIVVAAARDGRQLVKVEAIHDLPELDQNAKFDYKFVLSKPVEFIE